MANYRLYRLDGAGKISSAEWLEAEDDADAERQGETHDAGSAAIEPSVRGARSFREEGNDAAFAENPSSARTPARSTTTSSKVKPLSSAATIPPQPAVSMISLTDIGLRYSGR